MDRRQKLLEVFGRLYEHFGPQHWWPADSLFEVAVGAILTQNTSWRNVERAIADLKKARLLSFARLSAISEKTLAQMIKPAGYYNIKARRIRNFLRFLKKNYRSSIIRMRKKDAGVLRRELLSVNGIGPETADSILLYALDKPVFVVDAYTRRIFARHRLVPADADYEEVQRLFMSSLVPDIKLFNEYHALLVKLGKEYCKKTKVNCRICPIYPAELHGKK